MIGRTVGDRPDPGVRLGVAVGLVTFGATVLRLLVPETVGPVQGGGDPHLLCAVGVRPDLSWYRHATAAEPLRWLPHTWVGDGCGSSGIARSGGSSQVALLRMAKALTPVFGMGTGLDLRVAGVVAAGVLGVLLGLIAWVAPGRPVARLVLVSALWVAVIDRAVVGYFVSGSAEPAAILGCLGLVGAGLATFRTRTPTTASLVALTVAGAVTATAQPGMIAVLAPVLAALLFPVVARLVRRTGPEPSARPVAGHDVWVRVVLAAGLLAVAVRYLGSHPPVAPSHPAVALQASIVGVGMWAVLGLVALLVSWRVARRSRRAAARAPALVAVGAVVTAGCLVLADLVPGTHGLPGSAVVGVLVAWSVPLCLVALVAARHDVPAIRLPPEADLAVVGVGPADASSLSGREG